MQLMGSRTGIKREDRPERERKSRDREAERCIVFVAPKVNKKLILKCVFKLNRN
jgi:hypothetical protein